MLMDFYFISFFFLTTKSLYIALAFLELIDRASLELMRSAFAS